MPASWLSTILANIKPKLSTVEGLFQVFEAAKTEINSSDTPETKAVDVLNDIVTAAPAVMAAVTAATNVPAPATGPAAAAGGATTPAA